MTFRHRKCNFDIDRYLNPFVPPPPWKHLPYPVARFLGHRETTPQVTGNLMHIFWTFIGVFVSILLIEGVSKHVPSFESHGAPMIVGSFVSFRDPPDHTAALPPRRLETENFSPIAVVSRQEI